MDNNSIDFGRIYGISGPCAGGPCEFTGNVVPNTPSLEQIASYNIQLRANQLPNAEIERKLQTMGDNGGPSNIATYPESLVPSAQPSTTTGGASGQVPSMTGTPIVNNVTPGNELSPITEYDQPFPVTGESIQYLNGFMRTQIGRRIELQMLVGSDTIVTKEGYLLGIGANFILINEVGTNDITSCDFYNIKFVRYFY